MTPDLICPSTYQPLWSSSGDSGPDVSLDMSASLEYLFGFARASLTEVFHDLLCIPKWTGDEDLADGNPSARVVSQLVILSFCLFGPSSWNQSEGSTASAAEGPRAQDSQGKGIMTDVVAASSANVSRPQPSSSPASSFMDISRDAINKDFFCFSPGPYYATYPEGGVAGNYEFSHEEYDAPHQPTLTILTKEVFKDPSVCMTVVDQFPTPGEMVRIEVLSSNQLTAKMSVLHCLMMSHGGELLSRYRSLLLSHHELQRQVASINDKISSFGVAFAKSKAKGKERRKRIKSLTKSLDNLHAEVACFSANLNRATVLEAERDEEILSLKATPWSLHPSFGYELSMRQTKEEFNVVLEKISQFVPGAQGRLVEASPLVAQTNYAFLNKIFEHAAEPLSVILQLEPEKLARPANAPALRDARVSPLVVKESTMTPAFASLELPSNNGASHAVDNDVELTLIGSERVSSGLSDVVVALFIGGKGDGSLPSSIVDKEVVATSSGV
ncbi:hypothetical protein Tco_0405537 [Tanacetum coccineum]